MQPPLQREGLSREAFGGGGREERARPTVAGSSTRPDAAQGSEARDPSRPTSVHRQWVNSIGYSGPVRFSSPFTSPTSHRLPGDVYAPRAVGQATKIPA